MTDLALADIHETRRRNLEALIAEAGGSIKALGGAMRQVMQQTDPDAAGKDYANTISQYRIGKPMGPKFARDLERSMAKPRNWMDVLHPDPAENTVIGREAAQIVMSLEPEDQEAAMRILRRMQRLAPRGPNNPYGEPHEPKGGKGDTR